MAEAARSCDSTGRYPQAAPSNGHINADELDRTIRYGDANGNIPAAAEGFFRLKDYFEDKFGPSYSPRFAKAVDNFVRSLVGYSLATFVLQVTYNIRDDYYCFNYLLQVKDRHNANILIDEEGHIIHIDFGYILGQSPGFNINFENAPFKLTSDYMDLMGGVNSPSFQLFQDLFFKGFLALQKHVDLLTSVLQVFICIVFGLIS